MMTLVIDSVTVDTDRCRSISLGYDASSLCSVDGARVGAAVRLSLPLSPVNDAVFGGVGDMRVPEKFNASYHRAELLSGGAVLFSGVVRLLSVSASGGDGYGIEIRGGGAKWAKTAAKRMFNLVGIEYRTSLTPSDIYQSWSSSAPVRFLPVRRDSYAPTSASDILQPAQRAISIDDYHPFISVDAIVRSVVGEAGYSLHSRFMDGELFRSLYMSGAYSSHDTTAASRNMDFMACRMGEVSAEADHMGRVYVSPFMAVNSVGSFAQTVSSADADGAFSTNGCVGFDKGEMVFTPTAPVSVGFVYKIRYATDHRILSRTRLKGLDSIYMGANSDVPFTLANQFEDRRGNISTGFQYRVVVFSHTDGDSYRLVGPLIGNRELILAEFSDRSALVSFSVNVNSSYPVLKYKRAGTTNYTNCPLDWALYDGYIEETGRSEVELTVRTAPQTATPSSPCRFSTIFFYGADKGMKLTLRKECSVRPYFSYVPGFGSSLEFADVAQHRVRQSVLFDALAHMFNLRFYTDEKTKTLYAEPADDFYDSSQIFDWTGRIDLSQPIVASDMALALHESRTYGYMSPDRAASAAVRSGEGPFGDWTTDTRSYAAIEGEVQIRSPMFSPTASETGHMSGAQAAQIMQVGDRDADYVPDQANFTPRIVCYAGLHPLPDGQQWSYPSGLAKYPLAAFHFSGDSYLDGFTLCFEDRDGVVGLHRYYDRQAVQESSGRSFKMRVRLAPHELEQLFTLGTGSFCIASVFRFRICGCDELCTLRSLDSYDPVAETAICIFENYIPKTI